MHTSTLFDENDNILPPVIAGEVVDLFYAPVEFDSLTLLASQFASTKARIEQVHAIITQDLVQGVLGHFFSGNHQEQRGRTAAASAREMETMFALEGALNDLTSTYWNLALSQTDLMEVMPQARRSQWHTTLNAWRESGYKRGVNPELDMPEFNLDNMRATVQSLMARKSEFLAERVDGIFKALSNTHVTNCPHAFSKRMILNGIYTDYGTTDHARAGFIHDLRLVISKFMGRGDPISDTTYSLLTTAKAHSGKWIEADGGSLRCRGYKCGTLHIEIHPEMSCRLNSILAFLYPATIPESLRRRPVKPSAKGFTSKALFDKALSNQVCAALSTMRTYQILKPTQNFRREFDRIPVRNSLQLEVMRSERSKHLFAEVNAVMTALGGVLTTCETNNGQRYWLFDYTPNEIVREVAISGCIPDMKSHQFYGTPEGVAQQVVDWLDIQPTDTLLEPEAGQGGIADLLPKDQTICVEVSALHCQILRAKGHTTIEADLLEWNPGIRFSAIAMNPPFSEGRWAAHLAKAGTLVDDGGRLCAVLPMSARSKAHDLLPGFTLEFSAPIDNAFEGTSISVLILKATRNATV